MIPCSVLSANHVLVSQLRALYLRGDSYLRREDFLLNIHLLWCNTWMKSKRWLKPYPHVSGYFESATFLSGHDFRPHTSGGFGSESAHTRYVWTGIFESRKKKLRIKNYSDTCGRGLKMLWKGLSLQCNRRKSFGLGDVQRLEIMRYMKTPCDGRGQLGKAIGHYCYYSLKIAAHAMCQSFSAYILLCYFFLVFFFRENVYFSDFFSLFEGNVLHKKKVSELVCEQSLRVVTEKRKKWN